MSFPSMPTDNLYKFMAISGVVMIVASNYLGSQGTMAMQEARYKVLLDSEDRIRSEIWKIVDGVRLDHEEKAERTRELTSMDNMLDQWKKSIFNDTTVRIGEIEADWASMQKMLAWAELAGYVLTPLGFFLWWLKVQKYQDEILHAQYEREVSPERRLVKRWRLLADWIPIRTGPKGNPQSKRKK